MTTADQPKELHELVWRKLKDSCPNLRSVGTHNPDRDLGRPGYLEVILEEDAPYDELQTAVNLLKTDGEPEVRLEEFYRPARPR